MLLRKLNALEMKTFLLIASFICLNLVLSGQIAYYSSIDIFSDCVRKDTTALAFKKDAESLQKLSSYLKDYLPEEFRETTQDADQVFAFFSGNPFFGKELDEISGASSGFLSGRISNIASSVGNLNVTNFADGLAKFLVARAKEELNREASSVSLV